MSNLNEQYVKDILERFHHDLLENNLVKTKSVQGIEIDGDKVKVGIRLGFPCLGAQDELAAAIKSTLEASDAISQADVEISWKISAHKVEVDAPPIKGIKNIIAVASGKGGVGKSTTTVNLALALKAEGASVGILDADIYGPSQPTMLGVKGQHPTSEDNQTFEPIEAHGLKVMSIGFLVEEDTATIWRGPMVSNALQQLLSQTNWGDLDYLVIDLPPGTGDIQLTLAQKVPVTAALIVTTPQDIALIDAKKAVSMFNKVNIPSLGVVENMATHICSNCGHNEAIFGEGGGSALAEQYGVPLLGSLPLQMNIREQTDSGTPTVAAEPDSQVTDIYRDIARKFTARMAVIPKDFRGDAAPIMFREA
jgi:ATP-binding protein involved in chromosome partitioning